jgi:hypothetical protein
VAGRIRQVYEYPVDLSAPQCADRRLLKDRKGALQAVGEVTHAIEDFYSHTNWVETQWPAMTRDGSYRLAPLTDGTCDANALPKTLQSGVMRTSRIG